MLNRPPVTPEIHQNLQKVSIMLQAKSMMGYGYGYGYGIRPIKKAVFIKSIIVLDEVGLDLK